MKISMGLVIIAVALMCKYGNKTKEITIACSFLILLEVATFVYDNYLDVYFGYLIILYAYIAILFGHLSSKSSLTSAYAYILYVIAYFLFAMEDTAMEWGVILSDSVFYGNYSVIMYGCLAILVYSVTYDRMGDIKLRASDVLS
jgi:hypothetical protein